MSSAYMDAAAPGPPEKPRRTLVTAVVGNGRLSSSLPAYGSANVWIRSPGGTFSCPSPPVKIETYCLSFTL